ncbi:hypothetical protein H7I77_10040 [Mycolicibacterium novocastrense]|uniref:Uncharacterized protein n=1 Tax=Mycolicibacterium novocastrense TaxID=59813 RepID=A0AAW5SJJ2_MYCNV|nr:MULTISPECIES: hypothetical protein [Mycolicibacterium]MCV7023686.1 hypothetical protein [Mycolicibacterium novocastrense]MDX1886923.1 hypothetical protein [Mycolicibacterium sp. 120270]GAT07667.1 uncharacterized protein RMCN_0800 [Mycolicibacterium novocastrense]
MKLTERAAEVTRLHGEWFDCDGDEIDHEDARDRLINAALELARHVTEGIPSVLEGVTALRADFARLHVFDDEDDEPTVSGYRYHDEHNADVREDIEHSADALACRIDEWIGAAE